LGIFAYLTKPIRQSELREVIARVLGHQELNGPVSRFSPRLLTRDASKVSLRVLLAEDNAVNQRLASRLLEKRGHQVTITRTGREALAAIEHGGFDLVLMDVQMPEMDGFEATGVLRARERVTGGHVPVIALTAHAMKGDRDRCIAVGMDGYLAKPIRPAELDEILEQFARQRSAEANTLEAAEKTS
ncbi:MAG: response regulator, partial [Candidatus Acidiferrales bacterium]